MPQKIKRLYRDEKHEVIGGVCAGIGNYFNVDPVFIRAIFSAFVLIRGSSILLYIILWIIIPSKKH